MEERRGIKRDRRGTRLLISRQLDMGEKRGRRDKGDTKLVIDRHIAMHERKERNKERQKTNKVID